ncbi:MAG: glucose-1-phosphate adenylyltransferase [Planctomycetia bacterium]|nr:glucose-1-phosphate adenylyltransferase [Planctomycetia bacterium]
MKNILSLVLGGGRGTRLLPLTQYRSKPAVPLAGKYRLIDIPLSNCINSGLNRIYVLTQFNSVSLHRHIRATYRFDAYSGGFVELLAAQQTMERADWYQGTADAVRQNLRYVTEPWVEHVLVLSGDQLYRMNYLDMLETHLKAGADVTIAALPVDEQAASAMGIMRVDDAGKVVGFLEKPKTREDLDLVRTKPKWFDAHGIASRGRSCLASMGIYIFNRQVLVDLLDKTAYWDFGKEIFPAAMRTHRVNVHLFDGYWEDIGTIKSFYLANLALCGPNPPFELASVDQPIFTRARFLPPSRVDGAQVKQSLISDGCYIGEGAVIETSVVGVRCRIGRNAVIRNSVLLGNDDYQSAREVEEDREAGRPPIGIGEGSAIEGAIIDKNCRIGRGVQIVNHKNVEQSQSPEAWVCDGVTVIPKGTALEDGWTLGR